MVNVKVSRIIIGDPDKIWDFINQVERFPEWMPGVVKAETTGRRKNGVGCKQIITTETELGSGESLQEVVVWEPPNKITWRHLRDVLDGKEFTSAKEIQSTISITNIGGEVTLRMIGSWLPNGVSGRLMNRVMKRTVSKNFELALDNLQKIIAQQSAKSKFPVTKSQ